MHFAEPLLLNTCLYYHVKLLFYFGVLATVLPNGLFVSSTRGCSWSRVDIMTNYIHVTSWLVYDMTNVGCDKRFGALTYVTLIDFMTNVLTSWNYLTWHTFLTSWRTFWRNVELYDVMVCLYVLLAWRIFSAMTSFLSFRHIFVHYFRDKI